MYSRILDQETLGKVIAAAPKVEQDLKELARSVVKHLVDHGLDAVSQKGGYWEWKVGDLAEKIGDVNAHQVGHVIRELGLRTRRTNEGYVVLWNLDQLALLQRALFGG